MACGWRVTRRKEFEPIWVWWNVQGTRLRVHVQWNCLWMCTLWSATQSLTCSVCLAYASSLVFTSLCFRSHLLLFTMSSWFSLLWHCISSSNSFPVAILSHVFTVFSRLSRCGIYIPRRLQWTVSCKRSNCNKANEFGKIIHALKKCPNYLFIKLINQ